MKTIIIVHGIGGGDAKTKSGFSGALKKNVLSEIKADQHSDCWKEAAWEGVNDTIDTHLRDVVLELVPAAKQVKRVDYAATKFGLLVFCGHYLKMLFNRGLRQRVPQVLDYLLDLPLYIGEPRGEAIRSIVRDVIEANPDSILVGHSLGSLICYDVICQAQVKGNPLPVSALVTLGTPIGWMKGLDDPKYENVHPVPLTIPWINMYYPNDPVCLSKELDETKFSGVVNVLLNVTTGIGLASHTAYWKDKEVAQQIRKLANS